MNPFTFDYIQEQYRAALEAGYDVLTCRDFVARKAAGELTPLTIVNRVDIDFSVKKADRLRAIFGRLGVKATFFVRLHAREYNPFDFENYRILRKLVEEGHEIGYHSEIVDQQEIWGETAESCLERDIRILRDMLGCDIVGVASHGGTTGYNNLDFWRDRRAAEYDLLYEAYEAEGAFALFHQSLYVTDSEWVRWKCYADGVRCEGDQRSLSEHLSSRPPLVYLLIHPDTYFDRHVYE